MDKQQIEEAYHRLLETIFPVTQLEPQNIAEELLQKTTTLLLEDIKQSCEIIVSTITYIEHKKQNPPTPQEEAELKKIYHEIQSLKRK